MNEAGDWSVSEARQLEERLVVLRRVAVSQRVQIRVCDTQFVDRNAAGVRSLDESQRSALASVEQLPRSCLEPRSIRSGKNVIELAIVWHDCVVIFKSGDNGTYEIRSQQRNIARSDEGGLALVFQFCKARCNSSERAERVVFVAGDLNRIRQRRQLLIESRDYDNWIDYVGENPADSLHESFLTERQHQFRLAHSRTLPAAKDDSASLWNKHRAPDYGKTQSELRDCNPS